VGTATLINGSATLPHLISGSHGVAAEYDGDDRFAPSVGSTATSNPVIAATVVSTTAKSRSGWYRTPVTVRFTCSPGSAAYSTPCPVPVTLGSSRPDQTVTRQVMDTDGGIASVTVGPINIDRVAPTVKVNGVRSGHHYTKAPQLKCVGHDALSGILSCHVGRHRTHHGHVTGFTYVATATDRAGNTRSLKGHYSVRSS
jgi:hypothetical protein